MCWIVLHLEQSTYWLQSKSLYSWPTHNVRTVPRHFNWYKWSSQRNWHSTSTPQAKFNHVDSTNIQLKASTCTIWTLTKRRTPTAQRNTGLLIGATWPKMWDTMWHAQLITHSSRTHRLSASKCDTDRPGKRETKDPGTGWVEVVLIGLVWTTHQMDSNWILNPISTGYLNLVRKEVQFNYRAHANSIEVSVR